MTRRGSDGDMSKTNSRRPLQPSSYSHVLKIIEQSTVFDMLSGCTGEADFLPNNPISLEIG